MGKKRKLRKLIRKRHLEGTKVLVICAGKRCAPPGVGRAVADEVRAYAAAHHPEVRVETAGCLDVCKHGPIAASYSGLRFRKHVGARRGRKLVDKLSRR